MATATGSYQEAVLEAEHPEIEILRFDTDADLLNSLLTNKCEAIGMDNHIFAYFDQVMEGVVALDARLFTAEMGFSFGKGYNVELREQFNDFLKKLKADGVYDEIVDRWIYNAHTSKMPEIAVPEVGNPIRIATNSGSPPLVTSAIAAAAMARTATSAMPPNRRSGSSRRHTSWRLTASTVRNPMRL